MAKISISHISPVQIIGIRAASPSSQELIWSVKNSQIV